MSDRERLPLAGQTKASPPVAWGITGAGHFLPECLDLLFRLSQVEVFVSRAGREVLASYGLLKQLRASGLEVYWNRSASSPAVTRLYSGRYQLVVIAPATSNSIAKMAYGIADTLVTNLFAQAGKCRVPVIVLPTDAQTQAVSLAPNRTRVWVHTRAVDQENIARLRHWPGVTIVETPELLEQALKDSSLL